MKTKLGSLALRVCFLALLIVCLHLVSSRSTFAAGPLCDMQYAQCMSGCGDPIDQICAWDCGEQKAWCEYINN
jgi:hypothetical protein